MLRSSKLKSKSQSQSTDKDICTSDHPLMHGNGGPPPHPSAPLAEHDDDLLQPGSHEHEYKHHDDHHVNHLNNNNSNNNNNNNNNKHVQPNNHNHRHKPVTITAHWSQLVACIIAFIVLVGAMGWTAHEAFRDYMPSSRPVIDPIPFPINSSPSHGESSSSVDASQHSYEQLMSIIQSLYQQQQQLIKQNQALTDQLRALEQHVHHTVRDELNTLSKNVVHLYDEHSAPYPTRRGMLSWYMWCGLASLLVVIIYVINRGHHT